MVNVRAPTELVYASEGGDETRSVGERIDLLRPFADLVMTVGEVTRMHVGEAQIAVLLKTEEGGGLPDGEMLGELQRSIWFAPAARSEWAGLSSAPRRSFKDEVAAMIEHIACMYTAAVTQLQPPPDASAALIG